MSIAGHYLNKHALFSELISDKPHPDLFISIVIPCYDEPDLIGALNSLWHCKRTESAVEVLVVINGSENSDLRIKNQNLKSYHDFIEWNKNHFDEKLSFFSIFKNDFHDKDAGVGLARKTGMDESVRRFEQIQKPDGIIVGFDADSTCSENYLIEIEKHFKENPKVNACSIRYEHPIAGTEHDDFIYQAIIQYELYLRYYILALQKANHPFAYHTIGSAFAVRAEIYCKQGGMNKRKAGEDFYFLQKVIPLGNYTELNSAVVYPSPRTSKRVPFGTGAAILKMELSGDVNYYTYDLKAFEDIGFMIENVGNFFEWDKNRLNEYLKNVNEPLQKFLIENDFIEQIKEIKQNANALQTFTLRFFRWFNAFKVLKYMNFSHETFYSLKPVTYLAFTLIKKLNKNCESENPEELLKLYREF